VEILMRQKRLYCKDDLGLDLGLGGSRLGSGFKSSFAMGEKNV